MENLELTTTDMVDVIRVHATTTGTTTIHGGAGGDILNASPDGKNLETVDDLVFLRRRGTRFDRSQRPEQSVQPIQASIASTKSAPRASRA